MSSQDFLPRTISAKIENLLNAFPIITLTGPRQSGKTTLCRQAFPRFSYYNLEDLTTRERIESGARAFLEIASKNGGVIIDEAQRVPEIFSAVQVVSDENPERKFILSGSNNFLLMEKITQSLAGRAAVLKLLPFSLAELGEKSAEISLEELLFRGGFPRVWQVAGTVSPREIYKNYLETYLERDVHLIEEIRNTTAFRNFVRLCAGSTACEFNASEFANSLGVTVPTIQHWLSILEASYLVFRLQPFFGNVRKRIVKRPKIYFCDTGLACTLLGIENAAQLETHPARGRLFENFVVLEFIKRRFAAGENAEKLFYYRDNSQLEIDLIEERAGTLFAYEIKSATDCRAEFYKGLNYFRKMLGERVVSTQIIYAGTTEFPVPENGLVNFRNIF